MNRCTITAFWSTTKLYISETLLLHSTTRILQHIQHPPLHVVQRRADTNISGDKNVNNPSVLFKLLKHSNADSVIAAKNKRNQYTNTLVELGKTDLSLRHIIQY